MILPLYLTTQESAKRHARMPALVEKDNRLIRHCRASKYKNGPVIGMRVPLYKYRGGTNIISHTFDRKQFAPVAVALSHFESSWRT